ncbi:T9SS type A sorting domain-containing protein [Carboxylicivirga linearis]|uniref:T9SS type A sorting domain-containing protein n=1 Tax=Carboxylicivirga linearis TaxID=1628157 RepID=A0ABS5JXA9_9BACT|nr:T9SS type A sorting domain-containing protein [Carboxylicivirga linearis]MBS2099099.1 T9SS type A sorting domain-containing protein [Carboxylicivirga linearis]
MKNLYLPFILLLIALNSLAQDGASCDNAFTAYTGTNTFTGTQNTDQWFSFTANQNGKVIISSCDQTASDTDVRLYDTNGICGFDYPIASNDDFCGTQSKIVISAEKDKVYFIVWQNKSDSQESNWDFTWNIEETAWEQGEDCSMPLDAVEASTNFSDHSNATDQWFTYTPAGDGTVTISTCDLTTENTSVRIFTDCDTQVWGDDGCGDSQSYSQFDVTKDQEYLIKWEVGSTFGTYNWSLTFEETATKISTPIAERIKIMKLADHIEIIIPQTDEIEVGIYNMAGSLVKKQKSESSQMSINCSLFPKGLYIVQVKTNTGIVTKKILIDK